MYIDTAKIVKNKNLKIYKRIPKFLFRWLACIIHQDEINDFLSKHGNEDPIPFAESTMDFFDAKLQVINEENIPKTGRYIVVSNHPLGGLDGVGYISLMGKYRSDIKFPVNDLLMNLTPMHGVFIPINKHGKQNTNAIRDLNATFASDDLILYFPAGLCSRKQKGKICDLEWKQTIISKAKEYERDIIPAYFDGKNSNRFYRIANIRKFLGIKFNIEMLLLPDEMFRQKEKILSITFGKPISYKTFTTEKTNKEWAAWLKEQTYALQLDKNN
ncbi:MAG TPA: 1-acyl-sn-glycerol-3-phosphate acyltransferase [Bacteroidales bacterium]|nr:1-acyl-sn-glycerol-3-phosphate acyltransferase [Bacteroidales bacterium]HPT52286.1 1-acyl-sn-glycerol-3-phosphate acyltransferase [Bacteroidales bacterium]